MEATDSVKNPSAVAVVLTWNDTELAGRCIESLLANQFQFPNLRILVVDNGSNPPCAPILQERFPGVDALVLPDNLGFTGGANRGLGRALELGAEYVFFLNNDTVVDEMAVARLIEALEQDREAGAATALLLEPGPERRVQFYTGEILRDRAMHPHPGKGILHSQRSEWTTLRTEYVPACALMIRGSTLEVVGMFDERLGTNWEDYDWCVRMMDAGIPILAVGSAEVTHHHGATTGRASPYITYYATRNRLVCLARYSRPGGLRRNALTILRSFWWQIRGYGLTNWRCHRAFARGVVDFALGVRGKGNPPLSRGSE